MNDSLNLLQQELEQYRKEQEDLINKLKPLENRKKKVDELIEATEHLISLKGCATLSKNDKEHLETETISEADLGSLSGKSGQEAYKELINSRY